jgi:hypothetical protein
LTNARSISNKLDDFKIRVNQLSPDIVCVTESWLNIQEDNIFNLPTYNLFRHDRTDRIGGGIAIWAHKSYHFNEIQPSIRCQVAINSVWLINDVYIFCGIYIPTNLSVDDQVCVNNFIIDNFVDFLNRYTNLLPILVGDFNTHSNKKIKVSAFCNELNIKNIVKKPTRPSSNNCLDLIFVAKSMVKLYKDVQILSPLHSDTNKSDHDVVFAEAKCTVEKQTFVYNQKILDLRKNNVANFVNKIKDINWSEFYKSNMDVNKKCLLFYEKISKAMSTIPCDTVTLSSDKPEWITPLCVLIASKRDDAYRKGNLHLYKHYTQKYIAEIDNAKNKWANKLRNSANNSHSSFWKITKKVIDPSSGSTIDGLYKLISQSDNILSCANDIANHFYSVFSEERNVDIDNLIENLLAKNDTKINTSWVEISCLKVYNYLNKIESHKSTGSDGLPASLLKAASTYLAGPLTHIMILSVNDFVFPEYWKLTDVVPIPKKPGINSCNDLRPISLPPIVSKVLEQIIVDSYKDVIFEKYGLNQFAYRQHSSTTAAAIKLHDCITVELDKQDVIGVKIIAFDLSKAFDKVCHFRLLQRLCELNLQTELIIWLASYLKNRKFKVRLCGTYSETKEITSSVSQGSVLAAYLFALFISDITCVHPSTQMFKYADDITLVISIHNSTDTTIISDEINNISNWCANNSLIINSDKFQCLTIKSSLQNIPSLPFIEEATTFRFLGFIFDTNLSWNSHVEYIEKRVNQRLFILRKLRPFLSKKELLNVYCGYIRSVIEYGCPLFVGLNITLSEDLEKLQNKALKIISWDDQFQTLHTRRHTLATKLLYSIQNKKHILNELYPTVLSRCKKFNVIYCKTNRRQNSFFPYLCIYLNQLTL